MGHFEYNLFPDEREFGRGGVPGKGIGVCSKGGVEASNCLRHKYKHTLATALKKFPLSIQVRLDLHFQHL